MILALQGTKAFNDYSIFLRAMGTALHGMDANDNEIIIYTAGPYQVNAMVMEFCNVNERSLKGYGKKIRFHKVPPSYLKENITNMNTFIFLSKPKEPVSNIVREAEDHDVEVRIYRY